MLLLGLQVPEYVLSLGRANLCRPCLADAVPVCFENRQNAVSVLISNEAAFVSTVSCLELRLSFPTLRTYLKALKILEWGIVFPQ
jgi:hypothetical protein